MPLLSIPSPFAKRPVPPTFARASTAYDPYTGVLSASGVPRFPIVGGVQGFMCEEGSANKITSTPGSGTLFNPGNTTGWTKGGDAAAVYSVVTDDAATAALGIPSGTKVYKLDNSAGVASAYVTAVGGTGNVNTHTASVWIRGTGSGHMGLDSITPQLADTAYTAAYVKRSQTGTPGSTGGNLFVLATAGSVVYFCFPMVEEKAYYTSPMIGTRAAETLTIPTAGTLNASQGVIIIKAYVGPGAPKDATQNRYLFATTTSPGGAPYVNRLAFVRGNDNAWTFYQEDATATATFTPGITDVLATGWHTFGCRWSAATADLFIDGTKASTVNNPRLPTTLAANLYVGGWADGSGLLNYSSEYAGLDIFATALSDSEMAAYTSGNPIPLTDKHTLKMTCPGAFVLKPRAASLLELSALGMLA